MAVHQWKFPWGRGCFLFVRVCLSLVVPKIDFGHARFVHGAVQNNNMRFCHPWSLSVFNGTGNKTANPLPVPLAFETVLVVLPLDHARISVLERARVNQLKEVEFTAFARKDGLPVIVISDKRPIGHFSGNAEFSVTLFRIID
jgi:hypothetical protein